RSNLHPRSSLGDPRHTGGGLLGAGIAPYCQNCETVTEHTQPPVYEPRPGPPRQLRPRWRKAGRALWIGFFSLLGLVVLAVVGALVWLHTSGGRETLGRFVAEQARSSIQGDLRVKQIRVGGFLDVCVDGVELRDPDGNKVLAAERACVSIKPLPLQ